MSYMSHTHVVPVQRPEAVGHRHVPVLSHMTRPHGPVRSLTSQQGYGVVP